MDEPGAVNNAVTMQMVCVVLELLRFVAWIIMLLAR